MYLYTTKPPELMTSTINFAASHWIILFRELSGVFYAEKSTAQKTSVGAKFECGLVYKYTNIETALVPEISNASTAPEVIH